MNEVTVSPVDERQNVAWLLETAAKFYAEKQCLIFEPADGKCRTWTYLQFYLDVRKCAAGLQQHNVAPGDRVMIHADNCPEAIICWYGCALAGAVAVTTNTSSTPDEIEHFVDRIQPALIVTSVGLMPRFVSSKTSERCFVIDEAGPDVSSKHSFGKLLKEEAEPHVYPSDPMRVVSIQFTSGSTSKPKGVVWTHANMVWAASVSSQHQQLTADDIYLTCLPFYHTNAQVYSILSSLWVGATIVLVPKFSRSRFWETAARFQCTRTSLVPFCLHALGSIAVPAAHTFKSWGLGVSLPKVESHFRVRTIGWWGMTETIAQGIITPPVGQRPYMSMGFASPHYRVDIVGRQGKSVEAGGVGELILHGRRGVSIFLEYYEDSDSTAQAFTENGGFRTGDLVMRDATGDIYFQSRINDIIKRGGENISPAEVESVIAQIPMVDEVAVIGEACELYGEVPVAVCVSKHVDKIDVEREIRTRCLNELAEFKQPARIVFIDALPRTALGKIMKGKLRSIVKERG